MKMSRADTKNEQTRVSATGKWVEGRRRSRESVKKKKGKVKGGGGTRTDLFP